MRIEGLYILKEDYMSLRQINQMIWDINHTDSISDVNVGIIDYRLAIHAVQQVEKREDADLDGWRGWVETAHEEVSE